MLTNNKKSYFVKGIAMLMAMLMVLSVCLTGCGKKADEAIQKAENAQTSADEAKTAADAVYAALADYLKTADGATKAEVEATIKAALAPYATTEALAAYVKSEDYNKLVEDLKGYVTKAALDEALKGYVADAELKTIEEKLAASIAANKGNIDKALADLAKVATDAEVEAIKKALEDKIAAGDKAVSDALKGYVTSKDMEAIQKALQDKIAAGDKAVSDALAGYVTSEDMNAIQKALQDKIAAADKAAADVAESLKGYVKVEDYELLASSVQEATYKLMTIDRDHYGMVMETIAPYVADQEALAEAVKYLTDEMAMIDKKHADYINEVLADYVTTETYGQLVESVKYLTDELAMLDKKHADYINEVLADYVTTETYGQLVESVKYLTDELAMLDKKHADYVKEVLAAYVTTETYDELVKQVGDLETALNNYKEEVSKNLTALEEALNKKIEGALEGIKTLEETVNGITADNRADINANKEAIDKAMTDISYLYAYHEENKIYISALQESADKHDYYIDLLMAKDGELDKAIADNLAKVEELVAKSIEKITTDAAVTYATQQAVDDLGVRVDKLEAVVRAILDAFYDEADQETLADEALGEDLLNLPAETITALIKDKMSLAEWNDATYGTDAMDGVIKTIDKIQDLLKKIYKAAGVDEQADAYTKAAKDKINEYLKPFNIVMFDKDYKLTPYNKNAKQLEYTILRVPTLAELKKLTTAIDNANNVDNFADELNDLYTEYLFKIGHTHDATDPKDLKVQVVTIEHKGQINTFVEKYDELIIKYLTDAAGNAFAFNADYAQTYGNQPVKNVWKHPTKGTLVVVDPALTEYKTTENTTSTTTTEIVWEKTSTVTILIQDSTGKTLANGSEWKKADDYGLIYLPQNIDEYQWASKTPILAQIDGHYGSKKDLQVADTFMDAPATYKALNEQIYDAQDLLDTANDVMAKFLSGSVKKYGSIKVDGQDDALVDNSAITDPQYLEALTVGMCTEVEGDDNVYDGRLLNEVKSAMDAALLRNTCKDSDHEDRAHTQVVKDYITKYSLYYQMFDKAWGLTFELYRGYAKQILNTILYDYISVVDYTKVANLPATNDTALEDPDAFINGYEFKEQLTTDFLKGFLNNDGTFVGWQSYTTGTYAAIDVKKDFTKSALVNYYGATNGKAHTDANTDIVADPAATILEYNEELRLFLTSSVQNVFTELRKDDLMETAKKEYGDKNIAGIFNKLLAEAVANLDEVYNRFLFDDYKADKINETYVYATDRANFFSGAGDTELIEAMEHYLTGYSVTAATPADGPKNKLFLAEKTLVNASLTNEMDAKTVNKFEKIDGVSKVAMTATDAMATVDGRIDRYRLKLENMAIKRNYQSYLDVATTNVARVYLNYMAIPTLTYDMINQLVADRNNADTVITIDKFQVEMDLIALDDYKTKYTALLGLIAHKDQKDHYEYMTGETFDAAKADIKSTETHNYLTGINNVVQPVDALGLKDNYAFVGTAVVSFDRTVNVNTKYTETVDGKEVIINLYE